MRIQPIGNGTTTSTAPLGASLVDRPHITITPEQIRETIKHWDCTAQGQRLFVAVEIHSTTKGGIILPESAQKEQCDAVVISAGPLAYVNDLPPRSMAAAKRGLDIPAEELEYRWYTPDEMDCATRRFLKPGDRITYGRWQGATVSRKGSVLKGLDTLMVINADDVIGSPR